MMDNLGTELLPVKLDTATVNFACISQPESKPEQKNETDFNSTTQETVSLAKNPTPLPVRQILQAGNKLQGLDSPVTNGGKPACTTGSSLEQSTKIELPSSVQSTAAVFLTTFLTIFLAEIGDKTQLSTLLMSAQSHSPWVVFLGSAAALVTTSLLGVLLGSWIASRLSPKIVEKAAGALMLLISLLLFYDVFIGQR